MIFNSSWKQSPLRAVTDAKFSSCNKTIAELRNSIGVHGPKHHPQIDKMRLMQKKQQQQARPYPCRGGGALAVAANPGPYGAGGEWR